MSRLNVKKGARVVTGGKVGTVRFVGTTEFSVGEWVGIELDAPEGKNNGSVNGVAYFKCDDKYGLFVKKSQVRAAPRDTSSSRRSSTAESPARPSTRRSSSGSTRGGTPSSAAPSKIKSPSTTRTPPKAKRSGLKPPSSLRPPTASATVAAPQPARASPARTPDTGGVGAADETVAGAPTGADANSVATIMRLTEQLEEKESALNEFEYKEYQLIQNVKKAEESAAELKEQLLEKDKALAVAESKLTTLEKRQAETTGDMKDKLAQSAKDKGALATLQRKYADTELKIAELEESVEMLTLEKEEVELKAEEFEEKAAEQEIELESLYEKVEALQSQVKEATSAAAAAAGQQGGGGAAAGGSGDASNQDVQQLIEHNTKLRTALQKLNDQATAQKAEMTKTIRRLEKLAAKVPDLEDKTDELTTKNTELSAAVEDLKEQLDTASAFEEMVEDLSEKNLELGDKVSELETAVAEFEDERELNEELEEERNAIEQELNQEVQELTLSVDKLTRVATTLKASVNDREVTIGKYREQLANKADEMDLLKEQLSYLKQAEGASNATLQNALSSQNNLASVQRRAAQAALDLKLAQFRNAQKVQEVAQLSAFIPSELLQSDSPALGVLRNVDSVQSKFAFVVGKISERALVEDQVQNIFGEVSLREFARDCSGAAIIARIQRAIGVVDAALNHKDTPTDKYLEGASLVESSVARAGRAVDTILAAMRINGGSGVYAESLAELNELAPATQSAANKCSALLKAAQGGDEEKTASETEDNVFDSLVGHEDLLCAAQQATYLAAALLAKLRLCAAEFDNHSEPTTDAEKSRVTDLKREFKALGETALANTWQPACRALARLNESVAEARKTRASTRLTDNGAMTLQMLKSCEDLVVRLIAKVDGLLGSDGEIATALAGEDGASLKTIEDTIKLLFTEGENEAQGSETLTVLLTQLNLKVSMAESQVNGADGSQAEGEGAGPDLWKIRYSLATTTGHGGDVSAMFGAANDVGQAPWERRAEQTRTQLVEAALLPARVEDLKAEITKNAAALEAKQTEVLKAEFLRSKLESRMESRIAAATSDKEAAEAQIAEAQKEAEATVAKERKQLDLARAKIKRLDEKYKAVMKELRVAKRSGGTNTATADATSSGGSGVTSSAATPTAAAGGGSTTDNDASPSPRRASSAGSGSSGKGGLDSGTSASLWAALEFSRDRRNVWKKIALRQLGTTLPGLPRVIPAAAVARNAAMHPGPEFVEEQTKIRTRLTGVMQSLTQHVSCPTVARIPSVSRRKAGQASPTSITQQPRITPVQHVAAKATRTLQIKAQLVDLKTAMSQKLLRQHETLRVPTNFSELAFTRVQHSLSGRPHAGEGKTAQGSMVGKVHVGGGSTGASIQIHVRRDGLSELHHTLLTGK